MHSLKELFLAALAVAPSERDAWLERACGQDVELRHCLEMMLAAHEQPQSLLDRETPTTGSGEGATAADVERPGTMIGPYKLLQQIGEGGMGTVFMAEQQQPVQRKVALKIIKPGMDSSQVIARFEAERQALALMDHPNIARVLDAGETPPAYARGSPRPYFVMELVKGVPLTTYCDQHRLTPRERLELFVPVCQAVQHAHQKGIIHRDLKPSNVLVALYDGKPVPKVIDFGIAKATGPKLTEKTVFTEFGAVVGTLEYMSPEQAELNQLDIDTRSDIYALGVLLYELLTGTTPLEKKRLKVGALLESLRIIREEEPPRPSTRLSTTEELPSIAVKRGLEPKKLSGLVRGELDWIVMKCLEKDRDRRYETANGLARDLERYLHDEPVQAGPPSAGYRLRKFVRRNKRALTTVAFLGVMLLVAGAAVTASIVSAARDREERSKLAEAADRDRKERLAVAEGKVTVALKEAGAFQGQKKWLEALEAAKRAQGLLAEDSSEELRGRVREVLKDLHMVLDLEEIRMPPAGSGKEGNFDFTGHFDDAAADAAYARAFRDYGIDVDALEPTEAAQRVQVRAIRLELVAALDDWADKSARVPPGTGKTDNPRWKRLMAVARAADPDEWRNLVRQALEQRNVQALHKLAASPRLGELPLQTLSLLAEHLQNKDREAVLRRAQAKYPDDFWINFQLAQHLEGQQPQRLDEVIRFYTVARALRPRNLVVHLWLYKWLGDQLRNQGKLDEAIAMYREGIERHPIWHTLHNQLGVALYRQGKKEEAIAAYRKAIQLAPNAPVPYSGLGYALLDQGKHDEAIAAFRKSIELKPGTWHSHEGLARALDRQGKVDEAFAERCKLFELNPDSFVSAWNLGAAATRQGKDDIAIKALRRCIELKPDNAGAHDQLGLALARQGKADEAIASLARVLLLQPGNAGVHNHIGHILLSQGKRDEAAAAFRKTIDMEHSRAGDAENLGTALATLGLILLQQKKYADAEPLLRECVAVRTTRMPDDWLTFNTRSMLGAALAGQKKYAEAEPLLVQGHEGLKQREAKIPSEGKVCLTEALERLVVLYEATAQKDNTAAWRKKLEEWKARLKKPKP
jgi:serine/threonine protein kinase/Flp pilus assembly protein TadD